MDIYLNGKMLPPAGAKLPVQDAGLMHGVGLFETMAAHNGCIFRQKQHLARLADSASALGLARPLDIDRLSEALNKTITHNKITDARMRLTVTAGPLSLLNTGTGNAADLTVIVTPTEPTVYDPAYFEKGITVVLAYPGANPFDPMAGHKTLNYWPRLRTLRQAAAHGAGEAIWLNVSNHLASGSVSNLFLVKDDALFTPFARGEEVKDALPAPVLPGIVRQAVIEIAGEMDIPVHRQMLSVNDLLEADEVFLTNSSWYLLPVSAVEKKTIASGVAGDLSTQIRQRLFDRIAEETTA